MRTLAFVAVAFFIVADASPPARAEDNAAQITVLYDAFGDEPGLTKDWGFAGLIEYGGKRILFDTGNNAEIFAENVEAMGVDLTRLDFAVVSHRHGDHTSGLNHLISVNPELPIYAPKENFGGHPPETLEFGSAWPGGNFTWVTETTEIAPGFHLILLKGSWGVDLDVMELSLAIDTPDGVVLVVGCSHPTLEKIVEAAAAATQKRTHLIVGGTHLLPAAPAEIERIATALRDDWKVSWIAPAHCTGEPAFAILKRAFGPRYLYAGLGTTLALGADGSISAPPPGPRER